MPLEFVLLFCTYSFKILRTSNRVTVHTLLLFCFHRSTSYDCPICCLPAAVVDCMFVDNCYKTRKSARLLSANLILQVLRVLPHFVNKTNRCTEIQFYWYYDSICFGQPFCLSSGVLSRKSALVHFMQLWWLFATRSRMELLEFDPTPVTKTTYWSFGAGCLKFSKEVDRKLIYIFLSCIVFVFDN
jgi:hypothetical protein